MDEVFHVSTTLPGHTAFLPVPGKEHAELLAVFYRS